MQHVGERKEPSVRNLVIIVVIVMVVAVYAIISFATGDWMWFSPNFTENPNAVVLHCYGETVNIDPGSFHFTQLTEILQKSMSGSKRWDSLTMSEDTYIEYTSNPQMIVVEYFFPEPVRVHSTYKYYSNVDNLVIPLEGRHSNTNAVFGQASGIPTGGSLHIDSTNQFKEYLNNMDLCQINVTSGN